MFGIGFLDDLISEVGLPLVKKGIKATLGIDLDTKELTAEDKQKIMDSQIEIMKIDFEALKLDYADTANARDTNTRIQETPNSSWLAKNIAYLIDVCLIVATLGLGLMLFFVVIPEANMNIANIMFGSMLGYCSTIIAYHRGSSKGSSSKQDIINQLKGK